jgi:hypothetical protein
LPFRRTFVRAAEIDRRLAYISSLLALLCGNLVWIRTTKPIG